MALSETLNPAGEVLAGIDSALNQIDPNRGDLPPATRLEWVRLARRVQVRVEALSGLLTAEADAAQASLKTTGTPLTSWLGMGENLSRREASGAVFRARALAEHPSVGRAAADGRIGTGQAQAIGKVLGELAPQLDAAQQSQAETVMVELAGRLDSQELSRAAEKVLSEVAPGAQELAERRLQRTAEAAQRQRSLRFFHEGASVRFDGSLPRLAGEAFIALVSAHAEAHRRTALEARDPLTFDSPEQRRADALVALLETAQKAKPQPGVGTARVLVALDYAKLEEAAVGAAAITEGESLSAGELRRVCCDAELIPVVLGTNSEVLDVGRASRLVTPGIRIALTQRDGGCVFPGCDVRPDSCDAHHIVPWWAGGPTSLSNLALLCHHHHALVEPAKFTTRDQWELQLAPDGLPILIPPTRLDRQRRPVLHRRLGGTGKLASTRQFEDARQVTDSRQGHRFQTGPQLPDRAIDTDQLRGKRQPIDAAQCPSSEPCTARGPATSDRYG